MPRLRNYNVEEQLRQDILAGVFEHLPFLPSERDLAAHYETGRGVIRNVLKTLTEENLLIRIPRRGIRLNRQKNTRRFRRFLLRLQNPVELQAYEMSGLISGLCEGAASLCAEIVLSCPPIPLNIEELKERFDNGDLQGILFLEESGGCDLKAIRDLHIPCVVANLETPQDSVCTRMDYRQIGRAAGQKLLNSGFRRFGVFAGPLRSFIFKEMLSGFRGALAEEEISLTPEWIVEGDQGCGAEELRAILTLPAKKRPEAFFTMRDNRAELLFRLCEELKVKIPEELSVISYDDISWPAAAEHGLTTLAQDVRQIGIRAVELLRQWYNSGIAPQDCVIPGKLIERSSVSVQK